MVDGLRAWREHVVPVVCRWPQALDSAIAFVHRFSHVIASGVGIEAAIDWQSSADNGRHPGGVGSGSGGGDAPEARVDQRATEGIDGGLAEDDSIDVDLTDREVAEVLS